MDDVQHWLALAADVLGEPEPHTAELRLAEGLRTWGRAYLTVRTVTKPVVHPDEVALYPPAPWERTDTWEYAVESTALEHPLYAYNASTRTSRPATMAGVVAQGWELTEPVAALMEELGFTEHQMTIPLAPSPHGGRDAYALVGEDAYLDEDVERAASVQSLIAGLDAHVQLLRAARAAGTAAPDPTAVPLTPRERIVLDLIARGHTVEGIAARLAISPRTVHKHQEHLYRKLGAVDRLSAVLSAQRRGLIRSPDR
jgi:DNA-binding CsgD family transcriptional regulator